MAPGTPRITAVTAETPTTVFTSLVASTTPEARADVGVGHQVGARRAPADVAHPVQSIATLPW